MDVGITTNSSLAMIMVSTSVATSVSLMLSESW